jgi:hypothetical protein
MFSLRRMYRCSVSICSIDREAKICFERSVRSDDRSPTRV